MKRKLFLVLLVMLSQRAFALADPEPAKKCAVAESELSAPPLDQLGLLRIDSELKLLALGGLKQPEAALKMTRSVAVEIQGIRDSHLRSLLNNRLVHSYLILNRGEASEWLAGLPSKEKEHSYDDYKGRIYSEAVAAIRDLPQVQVQLIGNGLRTGAFQIAQLPGMLQALRTQDTGDAVALYSQAISAFPSDAPSEQDVRFLLQLTRIMIDTSKENAKAAVKLMNDALKNPTLQTPPQPAQPLAPPNQAVQKMANASLRVQVARLATSLGISDRDSTDMGNGPVTPPSASSKPGSNAAAAQGPPSAANPHRSAEFENASKGLTDSVSDDEIVRLATAIKDRDEQAQFYLLVLRKLQAKPASIAHLGKEILATFDGSDDPTQSLAAPRTVFHAALLVNDPLMAQFAMNSFAHGANVTCGEALGDKGDAAFAKGSACLGGYDQLATEIAKSPVRAALQVTDPSLIQRLRLYDEQTCDPQTTRAYNPAK
jgi:hypothetical protein